MKAFDLKTILSQQAQEVDDRMLDQISRSVVVQDFLQHNLLPFLQYAEIEAIRITYDAAMSGEAFMPRAEGFAFARAKLDRLLKRALKEEKKEG